MNIYMGASSIHRFLVLKKYQNLIFGGILEFPKLIVLGRFGNFGQFWADLGRSTAMLVVDSSLDRLKTLKPHNS